MNPEPLFEWRDVVLEFISFVASFLATGAIGFRFFVERGRGAASHSNASDEARVYSDALKRAALLGLAGAIVTAILISQRLPESAQRAHTDLGGLLRTNMMTASQVGLLIVGIIGLVIASRGIRAGWYFALLGFVGSPVRGIFSGNLLRLVNPMHQLFAGLWIGTLLILLAAGIGTLLKSDAVRAKRGTIAADMVNSFSPFALFASAGVAIFGVITAWRHVKVLSNLWSTPYGYALIAKLCVVAIVVGLGAWNWRRQRPRLGSEEGLHSINRSARAELTAAAVVLAVTGILVSIPAPRRPRDCPPGVRRLVQMGLCNRTRRHNQGTFESKNPARKRSIR
ncbi:MAG: CopD family protein [Gemmatimonadaceae bacterium]|nr:CopD family protein [Gemmatimonadaceae bacterium]